ncbi:MAG: CPBP family glutamic-type intramembrane protease [Elusimicrobiota bacterium]|jgi:membrane protease YdiL (CAAX protease family)
MELRTSGARALNIALAILILESSAAPAFAQLQAMNTPAANASLPITLSAAAEINGGVSSIQTKNLPAPLDMHLPQTLLLPAQTGLPTLPALQDSDRLLSAPLATDTLPSPKNAAKTSSSAPAEPQVQFQQLSERSLLPTEIGGDTSSRHRSVGLHSDMQSRQTLEQAAVPANEQNGTLSHIFSRFQGLFDGSHADKTTDASLLPAAQPSVHASQLEPSAAEIDLSQQTGTDLQAEKTPPAAKAAPRRMLSRALSYGALAGAAVSMSMSVLTGFIEACGYVFHSNFPAYTLPIKIIGYDRPVVQAFHGIGLAPIVEEIVARVILLGGLHWLLSKIMPEKAAVIIASVVSSVAFVLIHETADPVSFALRLADALIFSWVYTREGLSASIAMHSMRNAMNWISLFFASPSLLVTAAGVVVMMALAYAAISAWTLLQDQKADRKAGRIARHEMSPAIAGILAGFMLAGSLLTAPTLLKYCGPFILGLAAYAAIKYWKQRKP